MQSSTHGGSSAGSEFAITLDRVRMAVWAITLREYRALYGDRRLGFLWAFLQPLVGIAVLTYALTIISGPTSPLGGGTAAFIALGYMNYSLYNGLDSFVSSGIKANRSLLVFPRIKPIDIFIGRLLLRLASTGVVAATLFTWFVLSGDVGPPDEPLRLVLPIALTVCVGFGVGLLHAPITLIYPSLSTAWSAFSRVLFFSSGAFFLADSMPPQAQAVIYWNPILHTAEMIRSAWYGSYESQFMDPAYPLWFAGCVLTLGFIVERVLRKKVLGEL